MASEQNGEPHDPQAYQEFLRSIDYLVPEGPDFKITTTGVDPEISQIPGPQLVVPVSNARYALNAANARWGSLLDAAYGTDVIPETEGAERGISYNPQRGEKVFEFVHGVLDASAPWQKVRSEDYRIFRGSRQTEDDTGGRSRNRTTESGTIRRL
ncbi:MAG: hypothetical protein Ct9H90mP9_1410 [Pseudomonadota bacterium]|nr:MAG: hypothetical protein Ct9H90mP9_1410 [Pseudomonadota bacterium]